MSNTHPTNTGDTLEDLIETVVFADPATHAIRDQWEETKRTEQEVFERVCREAYERRLDYHRICQTPKPEEAARRDANLCKIILREEHDALLAVRWAEVLRKVHVVLAATAGEDDAAPHGGTPDGSGGR